MTWPAEYILVCETIHFLFALLLGSLAFSLTYFIRGKGEEPFTKVYFWPVFSAVSVALASHWLLDYAIGIA